MFGGGNRKVEIEIGFHASEDDLRQAEEKLRQAAERMGGSFSPTPSVAGGTSATLDEMTRRLSQLEGIAGMGARDVFMQGAGQLQTAAQWAGLREPELATQYQALIDQLRVLRESVQDSTRSQSGLTQILDFFRAQQVMQIGGRAINDLQGGRVFSAGGNLLGAGIGAFFGPMGMSVGSTIGSAIGGGLDAAAQMANRPRELSLEAGDLAARYANMGMGGDLRALSISQAGRFGYSPEETLGQMESLRAGRLAGSGDAASVLVNSIQGLSRALGVNAEATISLASINRRSGAEGGLLENIESIVGGAVAAGMQQQVQEYGEIMGSARYGMMQRSGAMVSDRAFNRMQNLFAGLMTGGSRASAMFGLNPQMAAAGMQGALAYGGTTDPYGMGAGLMRLAGIQESNLDIRFTDPETQLANTEQTLGFLTGQMQQVSGLGAGAFRRQAAADPNFMANLLQNNVGMQRQSAFLLQGLLGRDPTGGDIAAFSELSNIFAASGGLPTGGREGGRVDELLAQLTTTEAQRIREQEGTLVEKQLELAEQFEPLLDFVKETMTRVTEATSRLVEMANRGIEFFGAFSGLTGGGDGGGLMGDVGLASEALSQAYFEPIQEGVGAYARFFGGIGRVTGGVPAALGRRIGRALGMGPRDMGDTPPGGVLATDADRTFRFSSGDRVYAFQGGGSLEDVAEAVYRQTDLSEETHTDAMSKFGVLIGLTKDTVGTLSTQERALEAITERANEMQSALLDIADLLAKDVGGMAATGGIIGGGGEGILLGYSGNTGPRSTGPHLHAQLSARGGRPSDELLDRVMAGGQPLSSYRITSEHQDVRGGRAGHYGVDFAIPEGTELTTTVPVVKVEGPFGSPNQRGGFYTVVTFADGESLTLMHLAPETEGAALGQPVGRQGGAGNMTGGVTGGSNAVNLIAQFEGFHERPYWDYQQYSYGYGSRAPSANAQISEPEARRLLAQQVGGIRQRVDDLVTADLTPGQLDALTSFTYNVGEGAFAGSTLLRLLNQGDYAGAANEFGRWNRAGGEVLPGLTRRRAAEAELFRSGNVTINVNVASNSPAGTRQAAQEGAQAALDEFQVSWRQQRDRTQPDPTYS